MTDYTAKISERGCDKTGITEELIAQCYNGGRGELVAIVNLKPAREHRDLGTGNKKLDFVITEIEPVIATNGDIERQLAEHIRTITAALYRNRAIADGELPFDGEDSNEPTVPEVLAAGAALIETDEDGQPAGIWDGDKTRELEDSTT